MPTYDPWRAQLIALYTAPVFLMLAPMIACAVMLPLMRSAAGRLKF
jgi:hypothetical protein